MAKYNIIEKKEKKAAYRMLVSASLMDELKEKILNIILIEKKFKDKKFAAGCSREVISRGAEMLGMDLDELFTRTTAAMQG